MSSRSEGLGCSYYDKMGEGLKRPGEAWRGGWRGLERELVCGQVRDP
jgi:hypothetical protein